MIDQAPPGSLSAMSGDVFRAADQAGHRHFYIERPGEYVLNLLQSMAERPLLGMPVNVYRHSLQTASRCLRDGQDEELVVVALLHDIGEALIEPNHAAIAAELLRPFISADNYWLVKHHAIFQEFYYRKQLGQDHLRREAFRGHPCYEATVHFCERWDQTSFDPSYEELPLQEFAPMVRRLFACRAAQPDIL